MTLRLWLDDRRKAPWGYDLHAKTADECIEMLERHGDAISHCSLDHDLDVEHYEEQTTDRLRIDRSKYKTLTGYAVVEWMVANKRFPADICVHSLNSRGAREMIMELTRHAPDGVKITRTKPWEI